MFARFLFLCFVWLIEYWFVSLQVRKGRNMNSVQFNDAQLEVLRMVSVFNTPEAVGDLKQAISDYFAKKAEEEIDQMWADGIMTDAKVEDFRSLHQRTPYTK